MEIKVTQVKLLKFSLEYLIKCLEELESVAKLPRLVLRTRAENIIEHSIESFLKDNSLDNLKWVVESVNTFTRYYPDNVYGSHIELLDDEINDLYYRIIKINQGISL